jgi:hypothetical protein
MTSDLPFRIVTISPSSICLQPVASFLHGTVAMLFDIAGPKE